MRIVAISDQHGHLPDIPECDLLIVAGDQCHDNFRGGTARSSPELQYQWFQNKWLPWRRAQPATRCAITWGNHDFCGHEHQNVELDGLTHIVCDKLITKAGLRIYMTPWSNQFMDWAFMKEPAALQPYYDAIPECDILVSHQPPMGYGSQCRYLDPRDGQMKTEQVGSFELRDAILEKRPGRVVCGHVHSGYGQYDCDGIPVYNVSVVNEAYDLVNPVTVIDL